MQQLVDTSAAPEKVASGFQFTEGPVFSRRGYLLFSDIPAARIMKWAHGQTTVFREKSNGANGNTFDHQGRLLTAETGRVTRTEKNGSITVLASGVKAPNDLVYAIDGSVYFTDLPAGVVYQINRKGELRPVARDCERPNGVALAPNQLKLYVADTARMNLRVYDIAGDGSLSAGRVFAETAPGRPDGLKTDEAGRVWVAAGGIQIFDPSGKKIGAVELPEAPSNLNWGEGFHDLYVTAKTSVYRVKAKVNGTRTY
jgi:gluconolactonase